MFKSHWIFLLSALFLTCCQQENNNCIPNTHPVSYPSTDSLAQKLNWPKDLDINVFSGPDLTPSPACMAVAATGEVYVGVDMIGSLGKEMGKGSIERLVDCNHDGIMDTHTQFAVLDDPRGILPLGDQVFVLHTRFSPETKKAENMDLVVLDDKNRDGIADGPPMVLIENISNSKYLQERGTDHATNGIQMGIDGWIYIAVGDFGFHNATDREGTKLTQLGGGIVRVRPDGTEMEVYNHGMRNIYDVAIDPFMNIFTRGNTNDGGGWNVRFTHQIQSAEYGYPMLFKNFTDEIIPALIDVGGGSGTGALYMDDPRWPEKYNHVPLMSDWGRNLLYTHRVKDTGASFTQNEEEFIQLPQITDVDIDAAGAMYLSSWDGAGYSGSPEKGYVVRVVPKNFEYTPFHNVKEAKDKQLMEALGSLSAKARLSAQYELLQRPNDNTAQEVLKMAEDRQLPIEVRIASLFTYAQMSGKDGIDNLVQLSNDPKLQEFALRALSDREEWVKHVPLDPFLKGTKSPSDWVKAAAIIGMGRLGKPEAINTLLQIGVPSSFKAPEMGTEGPHATPNSDIVLPHLAVKALVRLNAVDACVNALGTENRDLALWALRYMHDPTAVYGLIAAYKNTGDNLNSVEGGVSTLKNKNASEFKNKIMNTLARIYHMEAPYDTSWWWSTRPDTHGPYYKAIDWAATPTIRSFMMEEWKKADRSERKSYAEMNSKYRLGIDAFGTVDIKPPKEDIPVVDLEKIKNEKGQVGKSSIEDVMLALDQIKGDPKKGEELFKKQGCVACHNINKGEVMKGPFMGQIGSIMNRHQIAESILKPNASISQGFSTVQIHTKNGEDYMGFVTEESANDLTVRDISGTATPLKKSDIESRKELETSMMPSGLANSLSYEEFASLVTYLKQQK
ncbi:c-type cytochrome [Flavobacteriaceae bacterium F89]|uniref:C-type cytochrome n=1 Tax=Cerina litoralis TaxID=2874477 RepID=A0AAE3EV76_9FLAO|nr:c-type cytochrome [Cerina litoralis]MCG2460266.1 c-type cytochrome [Cerina litoralis]